ncbi:FAD-linked oxidoreductase nodO [Fulvia fulva]|uniref:FAD-linked oxidoreductase nodO n=1 Tax=Passalora fulva TaxID=5499 RepID=A0A9Q8UQX3_PASFU|nr:FAD-linked oxidoreductase nodO [Fulvia fulva]KAK4621726.1 FAD-linked oxidoreductase nodO [Fulvia fulva]KAK4623148.1 FAD-linked oxidoreductase nodO [Fulvia fulva]UJO19121.1 FAD-linked oxidoreductase nodO [Fulvia fulva]WPV16169.1 FAD-linked oxidoreductase nodO [Fulvia fulva]WPV31090.1 FAD-linked oxidoreductase nodO [Fulvia fulva]
MSSVVYQRVFEIRGLLIDFFNFGYIKYNQDTEVVEASPATTSREICRFLKERNRFLPAGHCGEVGMGGFLLQGGMGYPVRTFGPTCRFVVGVDVVTATGEFYTVTKIITPICIGQHADPALDPLVEPFAHISSLATEGYVILIGLQSLASTDEQAKQNLEIVSETHPTGSLLQAQEMEKTDSDKCYDLAETPEAYSKPRRWITLNSFLENSVDVVTTIRKRATSLPAEGIMVWYPVYPASHETYEDMAWSVSSDHYVAWYASYTNPEEDPFHKKWVHDIEEELDPYTVGSCLGDADFALRPTKYWSEDAGKRLMDVRKKWDPKGRIAGFMDAEDTSGAEGLSNMKATGKFETKLA